MPTQRYVSLELTHFVGKGLSEDQQYSLLVNDILKAGWLIHPPIDGRKPNEVLSDSALVGGSRTPDLGEGLVPTYRWIEAELREAGRVSDFARSARVGPDNLMS
jgi:hypothetical protein